MKRHPSLSSFVLISSLAVGCADDHSPGPRDAQVDAAGILDGKVPVQDTGLDGNVSPVMDSRITEDAASDADAAACEDVRGQDVTDLCLHDNELRAGGLAGVALIDGGVDLGSPTMPRCPRASDIEWVRRGGESCWYEPLCEARLVRQNDMFSCCYVTRMICTL
jgi:hypothetical protein